MPGGSGKIAVKRVLGFTAVFVFGAAYFGSGSVNAAEIVALGASSMAGKGVLPSEAYPAQIEAMLRAKGLNVTVLNAAVSGDTTAGMLSRFPSVVDATTQVLLFTPGSNDLRDNYTREESRANIAKIRAAAAERHIKVIMVNPPASLPKLDAHHLTAESHHAFAEMLLPQVINALRR